MLALGKLIFNGIVYSNLWISIGGVCFALFGAHVLELDVPRQFFIFIFSVTLFTYNFQRLVKIYLINHSAPISGPRAEWIKRNLYFVYLITFLSAAGGLFFGWAFLLDSYLLLCLVGFFSLFYVLKLPVIQNNIRSLPHIKIYVLSVTWVLATQILPFVLFSTLPFTFFAGLFFFGSFLFVFSISIPFDIRDLNVDDKKLKTIPQIIGVGSAKNIALTALIISSLLFLLVIGSYQMGIILSTILTAATIIFSEKFKSELAYSGLIDSMFIGLFVFWYIFK